MAVTITDIYNDIASDRSRRLSITSGTSLADIMAAVETVLTTAPRKPLQSTLTCARSTTPP